jgi:uncharacterized membrane protein YtjA (UPF0391 family)
MRVGLLPITRSSANTPPNNDRARHPDFAIAVARRSHLPIPRGVTMLHYALVFLVIALIAGILGFTGIAGASAGIAKVLFIVFVILFVISVIFNRRRNF